MRTTSNSCVPPATRAYHQQLTRTTHCQQFMCSADNSRYLPLVHNLNRLHLYNLPPRNTCLSRPNKEPLPATRRLHRPSPSCDVYQCLPTNDFATDPRQRGGGGGLNSSLTTPILPLHPHPPPSTTSHLRSYSDVPLLLQMCRQGGGGLHPPSRPLPRAHMQHVQRSLDATTSPVSSSHISTNPLAPCALTHSPAFVVECALSHHTLKVNQLRKYNPGPDPFLTSTSSIH